MGDASDIAKDVLDGELLELSKLVEASEIVAASSPDYVANTQTWSTSKDKHPRLVLRPKNVESLSRVISFLYKSELDYKVRSQGFGSASAHDVVISMSAFDDFEFNKEEEYVMLGTGANWSNYLDRMEAITTEWTIVAGRTPAIGIGGSTLCSGFSWLSSEYGAVSDPANLLDAHVVTADGRAFWASSDPDLFWAMRGTETGFAIATHFKFRARKYPENGNIWAGPILLPRDKVDEVTKGVMSMQEKADRGEWSPKSALFIYVMRKELLAFIGATMDMIVVHVFDARGEEAGREAFKWALDIDGAIDQTRKDMTLRDVSHLQKQIGELRGTAEIYWSAICMSPPFEISEPIIKKSFEWWVSILSEPDSVAEQGYLIFELFSCRDNLTGRNSSAWPRPPGFEHMLLLGAGCAPNSPPELGQKAKRYLLEGPEKILGAKMQDVAIIPNALEDFHDLKKTYGDSYEKLREIKTRVDPTDRLGGWFRPYKDGEAR